MERYSEYKDSGVKWLGEIPGHWELRKMKYTFDERSQKGFPNEPLLAATQNHGVILKSQYENRTVEAVKSLDTLKLVEIGDFVISLRSFQGGLEYAHNRGIISPAYTILTPTHIKASYFKHLSKSDIFISLLKSSVTGIREGQNIDYNKLKESLLPIPPEEEQKAMGCYLDAATSKIDKAIAMQQKMIDLLNERKQIIIQNAVTKGLDENVEMKDSGVEWIGMIPKHWRKDKTMRLFGLYGSGTTPRENSNGGNFPWINSGDLNNSNLTVSSKFVSEKMIKDIPALKVYPQNSIIIAMYGASIGKIAISRIKCCTNQACFVLSFPCNKIQLEYAFYSLMACKIKWIEQSQGGTQPNINADIIKQTWLAFPSIEEQEKIVSYIQEKCNDIENASYRCQRQITLLQERKQIIINEVVTGKVKVS